jgi:hypothetical protein
MKKVVAKNIGEKVEKQLQQQDLVNERLAILSTKRKILEHQLDAVTPKTTPEETRVCKQCGRMKVLSEFRKYASKSKGLRQCSQGHWTICKDCEKINRDINLADSTPVDKRSDKQILLLSVAEAYYKDLVDKGLEPQGGFARRIFNRPYILHGEERHSNLDTLNLMAKQTPGLDVPDKNDAEWVKNQRNAAITSVEAQLGKAPMSDSDVATPLPIIESGDNSVKTWVPSHSDAVVRRHEDYKSFVDVENELRDLLERIEGNTFEGDAFDMDDTYSNIWSGTDKSNYDVQASAALKDLDATVTGVINTKMREE